MWWNYLSIPKLQRYNRWTLECISNFIPHFTGACDYLSMLGLKSNHVIKMGYWIHEYPLKPLARFTNIFTWGWVRVNGYIICFSVRCDYLHKPDLKSKLSVNVDQGWVMTYNTLAVYSFYSTYPILAPPISFSNKCPSLTDSKLQSQCY